MVEVQLSDSPEDILRKVQGDVGLDRVQVLQYLDIICKTGFSKMSSKNCNNAEKISWGRLVVNACSVALPALRDEELAHLLAEVEAIKKRLNIVVPI